MVYIDGDGARHSLFLNAPPKPHYNKDKLDEGIPLAAIVSTFWWVSTTSNKADANMILETKTVRGVDVPVLKNSVALAPHSKLIRYVAPPKPRESSIAEPAPKKKYSRV